MIPQVFLGIGWGELTALLILFVILFGPEKLPGYARKAARLVAWLRNFATAATNQLKSELGPEYQDLTAADLNPRTFVTTHLLSEVQSDIDEVRNDCAGGRLGASPFSVVERGTYRISLNQDGIHGAFYIRNEAFAGDEGGMNTELNALLTATCDTE